MQKRRFILSSLTVAAVLVPFLLTGCGGKKDEDFKLNFEKGALENQIETPGAYVDFSKGIQDERTKKEQESKNK